MYHPITYFTVILNHFLLLARDQQNGKQLGQQVETIIQVNFSYTRNL